MQMLDVLREAGDAFFADKAPRLGAALAYYSAFSLAPLLLISVAIAGAVFGEAAAFGHVANALDDAIGRPNAIAVQGMIQHARHPATNAFSTLAGVVLLVLGASGVFVQLKDALNTVWGIQPADLGWWGLLKQTFWSTTAVLGTAFLLMVSLILGAVLSALGQQLEAWVPYFSSTAWSMVNQGVSFAVFAGIFALCFRYLPDAKVAWRDVAIGAVVTAVLFAVGKYLLGLYIAMAAVGSPFGAAGSLAVVLIWVYYAAQILFFGAEITKVYARKAGRPIGPSPEAAVAPSNTVKLRPRGTARRLPPGTRP